MLLSRGRLVLFWNKILEAFNRNDSLWALLIDVVDFQPLSSAIVCVLTSLSLILAYLIIYSVAKYLKFSLLLFISLWTWKVMLNLAVDVRFYYCAFLKLETYVWNSVAAILHLKRFEKLNYCIIIQYPPFMKWLLWISYSSARIYNIHQNPPFQWFQQNNVALLISKI